MHYATWFVILGSGAVTWADDAVQTVPAPPDEAVAVIDTVQIDGRIEADQLTVSLSLDIEARAAGRSLLVAGPVVLRAGSGSGLSLDYEPEGQRYVLCLPRRGRTAVEAQFDVQATAGEDRWRRATLRVARARMRVVTLSCDHPNLDVRLLGALRVERAQEGGRLILRAVLGPDQPLTVQWRPRVKLADAKLVLSSRANTIVDVRAGRLHIDAVFDFEAAQGRMQSLTLAVAPGFHVTAVAGAHIRTWRVNPHPEGGRDLEVVLSQAQSGSYRLAVRAEAPLEALPTEVTVPLIEPPAGSRTRGTVVVGTDNALQVVVREASGLTQIDAAAFPHVPDEAAQPRPVPQGKAFYYTYAGTGAHLRLGVDDIVPSYDVAERLVATLQEDDLLVEAALDLDVREAPLRRVDVTVPAGYAVAAVTGESVEDYQVTEAADGTSARGLGVVFKEPVLGRTLLALRLELGRDPLGRAQSLPALHVPGAKTQRGYLVVAAAPGIALDAPTVSGLRAVHTASVPLRVAEAQFAYRFRAADWTLSLLARRKPAGIRAEVFHLQSVGEALSYGSAVINFVITGSPVDTLSFTLPANLENVAFVGRDVRRWVREGERWTVMLTRKVMGQYSLAVTSTQRYGPERPLRLAALRCADVQTQTGYVAITSFLDLKLERVAVPDEPTSSLAALALDELPADYRLLTRSPILAAYQYVTPPGAASLRVTPYPRSALLPVVVDIATHQTQVALRPDGRVESVTRVRYKVKNATGQFLALALPRGAQVWSVTQVGPGDAEERLAASEDPNTERLLIPLPRQSNPNDPVTLALTYGQVHGTAGAWSVPVSLEAPRSDIPLTYADWQVTVPRPWAITGTGGRMQTISGPTRRSTLRALLGRARQAWARAGARSLRGETPWVVGGGAVVLLLLGGLFRRRWLPELVVSLVLILGLVLGIQAAQVASWRAPTPVASAQFAQAVHADPAQALHVRVSLMPAWRAGVTVADAVVLPLVCGLALAVSLWRRRWAWIGVCVIVAATLYGASLCPGAWPVLGAALTWGPGALLGLGFVVWRLRHLRRSAGLPAAVVVTLVGLLAGCVPVEPPVTEGLRLDRLDAVLTAGSDSVEVTANLRVQAGAAAELPLLPGSAVLLSPAVVQRDVTLRLDADRYVLCLARAGRYDLTLRFLLPLPSPGTGARQRFEWPLPVAVSNTVRLEVPDANQVIEAVGAVSVRHADTADRSVITARFLPGTPAIFTWQPQERQAAAEAVRVYARDLALAQLRAGLVQVHHGLRLQIVQGQVEALAVDVSDGQTVTAVQGAELGAWRFDPVTQRLDLRFTAPVTGVYDVLVVTQSANAAVPYDLALGPLRVRDAESQHSLVGLSADPAVTAQVGRHPAPMNAADYVRNAAPLFALRPDLAQQPIQQAYRFDRADAVLAAHVVAVPSEVRSHEVARFNVEDERLVYNSQWRIEITKAGRFGLDLLLPAGYDIDALEAAAISHWDDVADPNGRRVQVHFKRKFLGNVSLTLALSQPIAEIPAEVPVPVLQIAGDLKHSGELYVDGERGLRLSVAARQGVSEVDPRSLEPGVTGRMAFRLLRPDWHLRLRTERVQARVTAQTLHRAEIGDGLVRHRHWLRYRLYHAGAKTFDLELPAAAAGVTISGPQIARRERLAPGHWRVELTEKVYEQPLLLRVTYETRYDPAQGAVPLMPLRCLDAELQQGYTVAFAGDRVSLAVAETDAAWRPAEARSIPKVFGAGDLSSAVLCYRHVSADRPLAVRARRHRSAAQVGAEVQRSVLATVVTESGLSLTQVTLTLKVGTRRHLQARLPVGARVWSLTVDGQPAQPSLRSADDGQPAILIPLPQDTAEEVVVALTYIAGSPGTAAGGSWAGPQRLTGPRFDLPLSRIRWQLYVPEGYTYDHFGGTLTHAGGAAPAQVHRYNLDAYEQALVANVAVNTRAAQTQQTRARALAQEGNQAAARQALAKGVNYSRGNAALNEDLRVDLDNLLRRQAKVALVNARGRLQQQAGGASLEPGTGGFSPQQAERIENALAQADSENLDLITQRILQTQEAAQGSVAQLDVPLPTSGLGLSFESPLQVESDAEMAVTFRARPRLRTPRRAGIGAALALLAALLIGTALLRLLTGQWDRLHGWLTPAPRTPGPIPATPTGPVTAAELTDPA